MKKKFKKNNKANNEKDNIHLKLSTEYIIQL